MGNKQSYIWTIDKDELQSILDNSNSLVEVLKKLSFDGYNGNHRTLNSRIKEDGLSLDVLNSNRKTFRMNHIKRIKQPPLKDDDVFVINSTYNTNRHLKTRLLDGEYLDYECSWCGNSGTHNGNILVLQLDHINGVNTDNRLENLRFLCPNCHSQTKTYSGKNATVDKKRCSCGNVIYKTSSQCVACMGISSRKVDRPSITEIQSEVDNNGYSATGRKYGVSDNAIRKWLK